MYETKEVFLTTCPKCASKSKSKVGTQKKKPKIDISSCFIQFRIVNNLNNVNINHLVLVTVIFIHFRFLTELLGTNFLIHTG